MISARRLWWTVAAAGSTMVIGLNAASAGRPTFHPAPAPATNFHLGNVHETGVGFTSSSNPNAQLPALRVGSSFTITEVVVNRGTHFGKPSGARVGRVVIECAVVSAAPDGICTGLFYLPNGFFTMSGNAPFTRSKVKHWAITGGIGQYEDASGVVTVTPTSNGANAVVGLDSTE